MADRVRGWFGVGLGSTRTLVWPLLAVCAIACRSGSVGGAESSAAASASAMPSGDVAGAGSSAPSSAPRAAGEPELRNKHPRRKPSGSPPRLRCADARNVVADIRARMASPPAMPISGAEAAAIDKSLGSALVEWSDPHGLWTAAPDTTPGALMSARASRVRAVLEGRADCATELRPIGESLASWANALRDELGAGAKSPASSFHDAASSALFEDGTIARPAKTLAREIGARTARIAERLPALADAVAKGRERWVPRMTADEWSEVTLAAAVRAYVPLLDPHGAWAPNDEVSTLYDRDLEIAPPSRLWTSGVRTAIGLRVDAGAAAPLRDGDIVIEIDGVTLAGLSAEAIEQLSEADDGALDTARSVRVLRGEQLTTISVGAPLLDEAPADTTLPTTDIPWGSSRALVVRLSDVPDGLGEQLARTLARAKADRPVPIAGLVLDLRGNGGGSIDGATSALGLFLPGAPLFPLRHRDAAIETERAPEPPAEDRWSLPVAALVDGGTASAAEMIAGALHAYRRGAVIGAQTYGKGCAQEYLDDAASAGVLRLTTLLYALPDGTAVQRVGLRPDIALALPQPPSVHERESDLARSAPSWSGPDVRDQKRVLDVSWPTASRIGPCDDEAVCRALRALSTGRASARRNEH